MSSESDAWPVYPLRELLLESPKYGANAPAASYDKNLPRYIRITDITADGRLLDGDPRSIPWEAAAGSLLERDDILFARSGATVGKTYIHNKDETCAHAGYLIKARVNPRKLRPEFLFQITQSPFYAAWLMSVVHAGAQPNVNAEEFGQLPISLPPLSEQRRIAAILGTWDVAIEKAERVLTAKTNRREHWHTALVVQFEGSTKPLHELITPVQRPVPRPSKPYTAIGIRSHGKGTFHRHVSRPEQIDMDTLFVVTASDLIVNITFAWEGAIALAKPEDQGCLVSHRFPTFEINEAVVNRDYLGFAVNNARFFYALRGISPGSAGRNRVLNQKDFLRLSIPFPPKKQQDRIAELLTAADKDIAATADLIARLKTQKSGLMQKLLTGEIRVPEAVADLSPAAD